MKYFTKKKLPNIFMSMNQNLRNKSWKQNYLEELFQTFDTAGMNLPDVQTERLCQKFKFGHYLDYHTCTENSIMKALDKATAGRTSILIAHRLSTVVNCDTIFVLDKGRVAESGTHAELLARPGSLYSKLWNSQHETALKG